MYVAFAFMICIRVHDLHVLSWFTFMICICNLRLHDLHLHSHVCCICICICILWFAFVICICMYVHNQCFIMNICMYICMSIYAIIHQRGFNAHTPDHIESFFEKYFAHAPVHMQWKWCITGMGNVICMFPPPTPVLQQNYAWMCWRIGICTSPPPTQILNDNAHVCSEIRVCIRCSEIF